MYIKCNNLWLASFPLSLLFVRLVPKKFWIYRGINLHNSTVTEKVVWKFPKVVIFPLF